DQLTNALQQAFDYDDIILVESCLSGPEFTVGIVGDQVLPTVRIEPKTTFYDFQAKYESDDTRYFCPGGLTTEQEQQLQTLAMQAYKAVGCSGWGR
ncbi:MAG: hypothetical protein J6562_08190, partial [Candidatus Schmidhempelia sp.]|nr:hypothetical protein [Candidatus Schmidhempelia sp.]